MRPVLIAEGTNDRKPWFSVNKFLALGVLALLWYAFPGGMLGFVIHVLRLTEFLSGLLLGAAATTKKVLETIKGV